jgi:HEAT repeat protein
MKFARSRSGLRALIALVGLCALLSWAVRVSRESRPTNLYAGWLNGGDDSRRLQAATELGGPESDPEVAIPALMRSMLADDNAEVRKVSAASLAALVSRRQEDPTIEAAARAFVGALGGRDPMVRSAAADGLGRIGPDPDAALPALLRAAGDESAWVRGSAVAALGLLIQKEERADRPEVRAVIGAASQDPSRHVRELAICSFWASAEGSPTFSADLLKSEDVRGRRAAVAALARSAPLASKVIPELTTALSDEDAEVRNGAAWSLMHLGIPTMAGQPTGPPSP